MGSDMENTSLSDYFRNKNIRTALLALVTVMTVTLFVITYKDKGKINTYQRIRVENSEKAVQDVIKLKMEALPPIPVKITIDQPTREPQASNAQNDTKADIKWDYN